MAHLTAEDRIAGLRLSSQKQSWYDLWAEEEAGTSPSYADVAKQNARAVDGVDSGAVCMVEAIPKRLSAKSEGGGSTEYGTTLALGKNAKVHADEVDPYSIACSHGLPFGSLVEPMCISNADMLHSIGEAGGEVWDCLINEESELVQLEDDVVDVKFWSEDESVYKVDFEFGLGDKVHVLLYRYAGVYTYGGTVLSSPGMVHKISTQQPGHAALNVVLSTIQMQLVSGRWRSPCVTNLHHGSLREVKQTVSRSEGSATRRLARTVAPAHAIAKTTANEVETDVLVELSHRAVSGAVVYGKIPAGDVPTAPVVVLSASGGKSVTGSVLVVQVAGDATVGLHVTAMTAGMRLDEFLNGPKFPPTVRDSVQSPLLAASVSLKHGVVSLRGPERCVYDKVDSILTRPGEHEVRTADPFAFETGLRELCELGHYDVTKIKNTLVCTHRYDSARRCVFNVGYEPCDSAPRWSHLLAQAPDYYDTSEEHMDYGTSGIARLLARTVMQNGVVTTSLLLNARSRHYAQAEARDRLAALGDSSASLRRTLVVDVEYMTRSTGSGTAKIVERFVYAVGVADVTNGEVQGVLAMVDNSAELHQFMKANPTAVVKEAKNWRALANDPTMTKGDVSEVMLSLQQLARDPRCRLYGKGVDNDNAIVTGEYNAATKLFRRQAEAMPLIMEFGGLVAKYEALVEDAEMHNPGDEALVFAAAAGFVRDQLRLKNAKHLRLNEL